MILGFRMQWPITSDLAELRRRVRAFGVGADLSGQRLQDLVIAAHEAASNVLRHGGGRGTLIAWRDADGVSLDVVDTAGTLTEARLRRTQPDLDRGRRRRTVLIRTLCDEAWVEHEPGSARLHLRIHTGSGRTQSLAGKRRSVTSRA
ncbi:ATP-binding protein [Nonomuraea ceibae]|uniref:ATP-binding protein n=1 Tax=Nonomuraea ceibae TaxID=1935170 RepID=UPI001C605897|nr:ATP-binding protein [Nonomuraea ceibae]